METRLLTSTLPQWQDAQDPALESPAALLPSTAAKVEGPRSGVEAPGAGERRAQALRLGGLLAGLERNLRTPQNCESPLRVLKQQIEHLNTILRVSVMHVVYRKHCTSNH